MKNHCPALMAVAATMMLVSCGGSKDAVPANASGLDPANFAAERDGKSTALYILKGSGEMEVAVTNFGGRIVSLMVPGRDGELRDVVLGFDSIAPYFPENNMTDFGAAIGRYGNRIDHGRLVIDGDTIMLPVNNFGHSLHGGPLGWQYQVYDASQPDDSTLVLTMDSPAGDNGFPGNVKATVTYTVRGGNTLDIDYTATTDAPTVLNLTNHSYFNLSGDPSIPVTGHLLSINASGYTPIDSTYMTTGEILPVAGTPMDFTKVHAIGDSIGLTSNEQIRNGNGYDHNWVLDTGGNPDSVAATLYSPESGVEMEIFTTEPGLQFYSGNFLDGTVRGKRGATYGFRSGMAMETQHYPDSPNKPQWPSTLVRPGETYKTHTTFKFSTR